MSTALGDGLERLVGNLLAVGNVEALQADCVLCQGEHGLIGDGFHIGHVEGQETPVVLEHGDQTQVGQFGTVGQGQPLHALARRKRLQGAIADFAAQRGQVQALDEAAVVEEAVGCPYGLYDALHVGPLVGRGPVPEQAHAIPGPEVGDEHAVLEVVGRRQLGEDGYHELGGEPGDGRETVLLFDGPPASLVVRVGGEGGSEGG